MSDIQEARDILVRWREVLSPGSWQARDDERGDTLLTEANGFIVARSVDWDLTHVILGTAGNPDFLDALDKMLESADKTRPTTEWGDHGLRIAGQRIAAAIIKADKEMSA